MDQHSGIMTSASASDYIRRLQHYSRHDKNGNIYRPLANFLDTKTKKMRIDESVDEPSERCVWYMMVQSNIATDMVPILSLSDLKSIESSSNFSACSGRLIFLRGFPSAKWLAILGHLYQVTPDVWRRHLDFLSQIGEGFFQVTSLPSWRSHVFHLRICSLGGWRNHWQFIKHSIEHLHRMAARDMESYRASLGRADDWKQGDSVVRRYMIHDKTYFSIEQHVTVYMYHDRDTEPWTIIVLSDCGDDLDTKHHGPWVRFQDSKLFPTPRSDGDELLNTASWKQDFGNPNDHGLIEAKLSQSLSEIHVGYGKKLDPEGMAHNPFYAIYEIFLQCASAECQILDMVTTMIEEHEIGQSSPKKDAADYEASHTQLLHFQGFLEHRVESLRDILDIIRTHGKKPWAYPNERVAETVGKATDKLIEDFEYLLRRVHNLLRRIERTISISMSLINMEQAKRSIDQNMTLFRFTVVASIYIPLSFTTSFFGMNFLEFGQGPLSIWVFFVASVPIFILSIFGLFIKRAWIEQLPARLGNKVTSWALRD
ncbi:uncharacterized protein F4807DRAFT_359890 [Annulohypoxylon truncatum]|uniref:uncharacterized protein n=1 Tax=Annulohypoxylon truncatum TaxID=327061 RepID=UPI002008A619|nr:uncharacterized protein F4807DRAFT_359890 [Annulohypoxylon truncatum]KAI1204159.1 hypothetical protein F4807DRAFT_359890 [Annulohypoxylon truncatum]